MQGKRLLGEPLSSTGTGETPKPPEQFSRCSSPKGQNLRVVRLDGTTNGDFQFPWNGWSQNEDDDNSHAGAIHGGRDAEFCCHRGLLREKQFDVVKLTIFRRLSTNCGRGAAAADTRCIQQGSRILCFDHSRLSRTQLELPGPVPMIGASAVPTSIPSANYCK